MSPESIRKEFRLFLRAIKKCYGNEYLNRIPTEIDMRQVEKCYSERNFPGCIGALDCMNLKWKNCPKSWKGQYYNPNSGCLATIQVEAVCDSSLYCWHVFARIPGTNNDLTVIEVSPLLISILNGDRPMKKPGG